MLQQHAPSWEMLTASASHPLFLHGAESSKKCNVNTVHFLFLHETGSSMASKKSTSLLNQSDARSDLRIGVLRSRRMFPLICNQDLRNAKDMNHAGEINTTHKICSLITAKAIIGILANHKSVFFDNLLCLS